MTNLHTNTTLNKQQLKTYLQSILEIVRFDKELQDIMGGKMDETPLTLATDKQLDIFMVILRGKDDCIDSDWMDLFYGDIFSYNGEIHGEEFDEFFDSLFE
jgi:hypothetical protein